MDRLSGTSSLGGRAGAAGLLANDDHDDDDDDSERAMLSMMDHDEERTWRACKSSYLSTRDALDGYRLANATDRAEILTGVRGLRGVSRRGSRSWQEETVKR